MKKTFQHPKADETARNIFSGGIREYRADERSPVYIDESGFARDMPRSYGYAPVGKRCAGRHDRNAKGRIDVIGTPPNNKLPNVNPVNGGIDADVVYARFGHGLPPGSPDSSVVVTDNAAFHRRGGIQQANNFTRTRTSVPAPLLSRS